MAPSNPLPAVVAILAAAAVPLGAQCPDGTPPPCSHAPRAAANSVAVLYLDNASRDTSDAYLADGLTEAIITRLGHVGRLEVASSFAVRRYRGQTTQSPASLGRALGVAHLVSGTVRRFGGRLLVTVELLRATSGTQEWANQFDRSDTDLLAIEQDIAHSVATAITGRLLPAERASVAAQPTRDPEAYDHFLRGNFILTRRGSGAGRAIAEYERSVELDPSFTAARARIALIYGLRLHAADLTDAGFDSLLARGLAVADRAIEMDARSSDAWMARGFLLEFRNPQSFGGVLPAFDRAVALDSMNAEAWYQYGFALWVLRRDAEAVRAYARALKIEPGRPITLFSLAEASDVARRSAEAGRWLDSALVLDPAFVSALAQRSTYRLRSGDTAGARADAEAAMAEGRWLDPLVNLAILAARAGDTTTSRATLDSLRQHAGGEHLNFRRAASLARGYAAIGDRDAALDALERVAPRGIALGALLRSTDFDSLRALPRFQRLVAETQPPGARGR